MGRNRSYDRAGVLAKAATQFLQTGYEGTSIDDLVAATGLHRGSLYQAFGSKRGIFLAALTELESIGMLDAESSDLVLVALLELAPRDHGVRATTARILASAGPLGGAESLGTRLLARAGLDTTSI